MAVEVAGIGSEPVAAGGPRHLLAVAPLPGLDALVVEAQAVIERLAQEAARTERSGEPAPGVLQTLRTVEAAVNTLGIARLTLVRVAKAQATRSDLGGERSFGDWFARETRQGRGAAAAQERVAETLSALPAVEEAVADGGLTLGHVGAVAQVMAGASERVRERLSDRAEEIVAAGRVLDVPQLRRRLAAEAAALEAESADRSFHGARARRFLRLSPRSGGVSLEGFLDPVAGETLRTAIEAATARPSVDDDRTGEQRAADALVDLTSRILAVGLDKKGAQLRPQITVLVREDTFLLLQWRRRLAAEGCPTATLTTDAFGRSGLSEPPPLAELLDGTLIPFAALDVLACDATVQRLVLDPVGEPLDLGRSERTYVDGARRAVLTRDRHCQWPGCTMRAQWCEVHHLVRWADDGDTATELGVTLCSNHHHRVHELGVRIRKVRAGFVFSHRDGRAIGETTRVHDRLLVPGGAAPSAGEDPGTANAPPGGGLRRARDASGSPPTLPVSRGEPPGPPLPLDSAEPPDHPDPLPGLATDDFPEDCPARLW